jgi:hypothetical protein
MYICRNIRQMYVNTHTPFCVLTWGGCKGNIMEQKVPVHFISIDRRCRSNSMLKKIHNCLLMKKCDYLYLVPLLKGVRDDKYVHKKRAKFSPPISTKLTNYQQNHFRISYTEYHQLGDISFTSVSKVQLPLSRISRNSLSLATFCWVF